MDSIKIEFDWRTTGNNHSVCHLGNNIDSIEINGEKSWEHDEIEYTIDFSVFGLSPIEVTAAKIETAIKLASEAITKEIATFVSVA